MKDKFKNKKLIAMIILLVILLCLIIIHLSLITDFKKTGNNIHKRVNHTASLLPNGKVLVAGGLDDDLGGGPSNTAEIYDPKTQKFSLTRNLLVKRINPQSILLKNGKVLIVGGVDDLPMYKNQIKIAELYDYKSGKFSRTGDLNIPRLNGFKLTLLNDGRVLVTGGLTTAYGIRKNNCEIYDPNTAKFKLISPMKFKRDMHNAVLLKNGNVLIVGGNTTFNTIDEKSIQQAAAGAGIESTTEIFNSKTEKFSLAGNIIYRIIPGASILLPDGNVLIIGGFGKKADDNNKFYDTKSVDREFYPKNRKYYTIPHSLYTAEIYDINKNKVVKVLQMNARHGRPTFNILKNGNILIFGTNQKDKQRVVNTDYSIVYTKEDNNFEEIFDIKSNTFKKIKNIGYSRGQHTATTLKNGQVLIVGGTSYPRHNIPNLILGELK
ncbi:MAG: kelch repeat-containing protein [bacterium]